MLRDVYDSPVTIKEMIHAPQLREATYRYQDVGDGSQASDPYIYGMVTCSLATNRRLEP